MAGTYALLAMPQQTQQRGIVLIFVDFSTSPNFSSRFPRCCIGISGQIGEWQQKGIDLVKSTKPAKSSGSG
jgi:hypothetical protein